MGVHSFHVFDRKGKTLFTKRYVKDAHGDNEDPEKLAEQRKLVFGMLFSLREVANSLSPDPATLPPPQSKQQQQQQQQQGPPPVASSGLHSVKTGASTLYNYETNSGLRFVLYVSNKEDGSNLTPDHGVRAALEYVYNEMWIQCVTRSPLYRPTQPNVQDTNFEQKLDLFLRSQPWYR